MSKSLIITESHHGWRKKMYKKLILLFKKFLTHRSEKERRSWKHTTAHNFPPHMFNIKKTSLNGTQHIRKLYIYFLFSLKVFFLTFFSLGQKRRRLRRRKMKTQQNFRVKMEMMEREEGKSKQMKKSMLDKREKTQVKTSSEAAKANNNFFVCTILIYFC